MVNKRRTTYVQWGFLIGVILTAVGSAILFSQPRGGRLLLEVLYVGAGLAWILTGLAHLINFRGVMDRSVQRQHETFDALNVEQVRSNVRIQAMVILICGLIAMTGTILVFSTSTNIR